MALANLELRSTLRPDGEVEVSLDQTLITPPDTDEILVEMHATPLHPVDMAMLFARSDPSTAMRADRDGRRVVLLRATSSTVESQKARWNIPLPLGSEGAGRVVAAGASDQAQALVGSKVAIWGGGTYARYRKVRAANAMVLPTDVSMVEGAFAHLNPLTALGMVEAMRIEGHRALVHTAAASSIGQFSPASARKRISRWSISCGGPNMWRCCVRSGPGWSAIPAERILKPNWPRRCARPTPPCCSTLPAAAIWRAGYFIGWR